MGKKLFMFWLRDRLVKHEFDCLGFGFTQPCVYAYCARSGGRATASERAMVRARVRVRVRVVDHSFGL